MRIILLWDWIIGQDPSSSSYILVNASTSIVPKYKILILIRRSLILSYNGLSFPWDWFCDHHYLFFKGELKSQLLLKKLVLKMIIIPIIYYLSYIMHCILLYLPWNSLIRVNQQINHESSTFSALTGLIGKINCESSALVP